MSLCFQVWQYIHHTLWSNNLQHMDRRSADCLVTGVLWHQSTWINIGSQCHLVKNLPYNSWWKLCSVRARNHFTRDGVAVGGGEKYLGKRFNCVFCVFYVTGPLCAGMGGKKKKKMMYLTTKNAGKKICSITCCMSSLPCPSLSNCWFLTRIWPSWVADLWRSCQSPTLQEEDAGSDWSTGGWSSQSEEQVAGVWPTALWHHHPL